MKRIQDSPIQIITFERAGRWVCRYGIQDWSAGSLKWKPREKSFGTKDEAELYRERRVSEMEVLAKGRSSDDPGLAEGVKFGDVVEGKSGSLADDWRCLLWQAMCLVAITPHDEDLRERCKVIGSLASQGRKFLDQQSLDQPVSEISQEAMLENMLKIVNETTARVSKEKRDEIMGRINGFKTSDTH